MNRIRVSTFLLSAVILFPQLAQAQGQSNRTWQSDVFLYGLAASISGDAQLGPVQQPVDVSFGDILDNLQMGFMGSYRGSSERFSVAADFVYLALGNASTTGLVRRADVDLFIADLTGGYRFSSGVEAFAGLRITDLSTKIGLGDPVITELEGSDTFYDPVVGVRIWTPLGQDGRWWIQARGDIGGFGASMDFTWTAMAHVGFNPTERISIVGGYRALGQDFKDAGPTEIFDMDVTYYGPLFGVGFHF